MNAEHAKQILITLLNWYEKCHGGPSAGSLLFNDDRTFKEHIEMALGGLKMPLRD